MKKSLALLIVLSFVGVALAASIPAWLDDGISNWNSENPGTQIEFLDIKDSFVWYTISKRVKLDREEITERMYAVVEANDYEKTAEEELITTGKPPTKVAPYTSKKCWRRSFTTNVDVGRQRMLTTQLCEDGDNWYAGFRVLQ